MRFARLIIAALVFFAGNTQAVVTVNPNGVNVRSSGPTTVFLTFQSLDPNEVAVEAFWCGAVQAGVVGGSVTTFNPCVPGTLFGVLPLRNDQSRLSQSGTFRNLTDIMSIPAAVARRAYQDAQTGQSSEFFYVRRFTGGVGGDKFVVVTCRMGGGGARSPLALLDVRLAFHTQSGDAPILAVARGQTVPRFGATVLFNGSGTLKGRWEVVLPGDPEPSDQDLLTEATLPVEQRAQQRRYTLIERFELFLTPDGKIYVPGPDPSRVPVQADGAYKLLLRIEASDDKEGDSNTGGGRIARSGGVAGFPMPVLRYFVGSPEAITSLGREAALPVTEGVTLLLPEDGVKIARGAKLSFSWLELPNVALYRVEFSNEREVVFSALVRAGAGQYLAPSWLPEKETSLRWRVQAIARGSGVMAQSAWRKVNIER